MRATDRKNYAWEGGKPTLERNERTLIDLKSKYEGCGKVCKSNAEAGTAPKTGAPSPNVEGEIRVWVVRFGKQDEGGVYES